MKFIYKGIGLISILFIVASCSFSTMGYQCDMEQKPYQEFRRKHSHLRWLELTGRRKRFS